MAQKRRHIWRIHPSTPAPGHQIPLLDGDRCTEGCGFLSRTPADPREEALISQSHSERDKLKIHVFGGTFCVASISDGPGVSSAGGFAGQT